MREAAAQLGVSVDAIRRRIKVETLSARQEPILGGHRWLVFVPGVASDDESDAEGGSTIPIGPSGTTPIAEDIPDPGLATPLGGETPDLGQLVAVQRAGEMARYTATLLEPWRLRVEELSRENGHLEERAEHLRAERDAARAELAEARQQAEEARLEADETARLAEEASAARELPAEGQPWWRFW